MRDEAFRDALGQHADAIRARCNCLVLARQQTNRELALERRYLAAFNPVLVLYGLEPVELADTAASRPVASDAAQPVPAGQA